VNLVITPYALLWGLYLTRWRLLLSNTTEGDRMNLLVTSLGSMSERAAAYLEQINDRERRLVHRECLRREIENDILAATIAIKRARFERRPFTGAERSLIAHAERHVRRGAPPPAHFAPIGRAGRRPHRTMLSLADPGNGHLRVTLRDADLLDGVIVHHEVIARGAVRADLSLASPAYRMIDTRQNGVIRLHAADDVPVRVYGGHPAYQLPSWHGAPSGDRAVTGAYEADPLTPCHLAAAAASAAFANGVADVKFNLSGLTVLQAIDFMRRVRNAVDRDEHQTLSTQFSLCVPVVDDRGLTCARRLHRTPVSEAAAIAALSVEMTQAGGWERVTLDSASRELPSVPLVDLLGVDALTRWVQCAHAAGLETYISGGMMTPHIDLAVQAGVDGLGLGFWIHSRGRAPGLPGALDAKRVLEAIRLRNEAEARL
jgi:uncharacterized protein (UPF0264 family)